MGLLKPDLYRSFAVGFVLGTAAMVAALGMDSGKDLASQVIPVAQAAPVHPDQTRVGPAADQAR